MENRKSAKGQGTSKSSSGKQAKSGNNTRTANKSASMPKKESGSLLKQFFIEQLQDAPLSSWHLKKWNTMK